MDKSFVQNAAARFHRTTQNRGIKIERQMDGQMRKIGDGNGNG